MPLLSFNGCYLCHGTGASLCWRWYKMFPEIASCWRVQWLNSMGVLNLGGDTWEVRRKGTDGWLVTSELALHSSHTLKWIRCHCRPSVKWWAKEDLGDLLNPVAQTQDKQQETDPRHGKGIFCTLSLKVIEDWSQRWTSLYQISILSNIKFWKELLIHLLPQNHSCSWISRQSSLQTLIREK